jgi:hypothetical protein
MVAAGKIFVEHSRVQNGNTAWHGYVDHLLEIINGIGFHVSPEAMSACISIHY